VEVKRGRKKKKEQEESVGREGRSARTGIKGEIQKKILKKRGGVVTKERGSGGNHNQNWAKIKQEMKGGGYVKRKKNKKQKAGLARKKGVKRKNKPSERG